MGTKCYWEKFVVRTHQLTFSRVVRCKEHGEEFLTQETQAHGIRFSTRIGGLFYYRGSFFVDRASGAPMSIAVISVVKLCIRAAHVCSYQAHFVWPFLAHCLGNKSLVVLHLGDPKTVAGIMLVG